MSFKNSLFEGGALQFKTLEIDQILKFHFTQSIFDLIIIASVKALILFILIRTICALWDLNLALQLGYVFRESSYDDIVS